MPSFRNQTTGSLTTNGQSLSLAYREFFNGGIGVQVTGTWTGTLEFRMTIDGTNSVAVIATDVTSGTQATTTTANGVFKFDVVGALAVSVASTAAMTGTATVTLVALPG